MSKELDNYDPDNEAFTDKEWIEMVIAAVKINIAEIKEELIFKKRKLKGLEQLRKIQPRTIL